MTQHNLYWTQHEVSFGVWDQEKCTGLLAYLRSLEESYVP
jgi:hypothetical protein